PARIIYVLQRCVDGRIGIWVRSAAVHIELRAKRTRTKQNQNPWDQHPERFPQPVTISVHWILPVLDAALAATELSSTWPLRTGIAAGTWRHPAGATESLQATWSDNRVGTAVCRALSRVVTLGAERRSD